MSATPTYDERDGLDPAAAVEFLASLVPDGGRGAGTGPAFRRGGRWPFLLPLAFGRDGPPGHGTPWCRTVAAARGARVGAA